MPYSLDIGNSQQCIIDNEDIEKVLHYKWRIVSYKNGIQYVVTGKNPVIGMHRILLKCPKGYDVDHINGNGFDNRRCNLRIATRQINTINSRLSSQNTSGYRGITFDKKSEKWRARFKMRKEQKRLYFNFGYHTTKEEAFLAYKKGLSRIFGEEFVKSCQWN